LDIKGWNVTLDPDNGPIFSPQALTYTWEHLGSGLEGLLNNTVYAIAISGNDVYVGGFFTDAGGDPNADYIARWDGTSWNALGTTPLNGLVYAIAISGNDVYVGGSFTNAGGVSNANRIARWNIANSTWNALGTGITTGVVYAIAISGNDVYVGGSFTNAGGVTGANRIARWNITSRNWNLVGAANAINNNTVRAIAISGNDVYVGGDFINAGGDPNANYIAHWDSTSWNALGTGITGVSVYAIAISGNDVYVGGDFTNAGGVPGTSNIARWNITSSKPR
jgi:hypothetical protein